MKRKRFIKGRKSEIQVKNIMKNKEKSGERDKETNRKCEKEAFRETVKHHAP